MSARSDLSLARTKAKKVALIGNSVCPEVAEKLVRANFPDESAERGAARSAEAEKKPGDQRSIFDDREPAPEPPQVAAGGDAS